MLHLGLGSFLHSLSSLLASFVSISYFLQLKAYSRPVLLLSPSCKLPTDKPAWREKYSCTALEKRSAAPWCLKGQAKTSFLYWKPLEIRSCKLIPCSESPSPTAWIGLVEWKFFSWHQIFAVESFDFSGLPEKIFSPNKEWSLEIMRGLWPFL